MSARTTLAMMTLAIAGLCSTALAADPSTAFTYQGQLKKDGRPFDGRADMRFTLWHDPTDPRGHPPSLDRTVDVVDGLFTVALDFGDSPFSSARWLEIAVKQNMLGGAEYVALEPRQPITAAPYALYALNSADGGGGTLDEAYDFGGAGLGRTITADAGAVSISGPDGLNVLGGIASGPVRINSDGYPFDLTLSRGPLFGDFEPQLVTLGGRVRTGTLGSPVDHWAYLSVGVTIHRIVRDAGSDFRFGVQSSTGGVITDVMTLDNSNNVGIGTTAPGAKLHVIGGLDAEPGFGGSLVIGSTSSTNLAFDGNEIMARDGGALATLAINADGGNVNLIQSGPGAVGIGTSSPKGKLHVNGDIYAPGHLYLHAYEGDGSSGTAYVQARDTSNSSILDMRLRTKNGTSINDVMTLKANGRVGIGTTAPAQLLHVNGTARVNVLQITGGADLSESFDIEAEAVTPGMVVVIDSKNPGRLIPSTRKYDRTVAGVISGAGGIQPGMLMAQEGTVASGKHPVALTGRVYCLVDASAMSIEPGDLLTTSDTPGHAMKVIDHTQANGAVLGKAMTPLARGEKGLVLVLVSLQ